MAYSPVNLACGFYPVLATYLTKYCRDKHGVSKISLTFTPNGCVVGLGDTALCLPDPFYATDDMVDIVDGVDKITKAIDDFFAENQCAKPSSASDAVNPCPVTGLPSAQ